MELPDTSGENMNQVIHVEPAQVPAAVASVTPVLLLQRAVESGADLDKLEKLMALQERWVANEAKKAFTAAKAAFKAENVTVTKDKENKQYKSTYTSLGNLVSTVSPILSKHGLSADWDIDQSHGIEVTCILSHSMGHSERVSLQVPPDTAGAKNPIQQIKSAITYAKAVTFESVCGLASTDANSDDDGNGAGRFDTTLADKWIAEIKKTADVPALDAVWPKAIAEIRAVDDKHAYDEVKAAFVARKKELTGAN